MKRRSLRVGSSDSGTGLEAFVSSKLDLEPGVAGRGGCTGSIERLQECWCSVKPVRLPEPSPTSFAVVRRSNATWRSPRLDSPRAERSICRFLKIRLGLGGTGRRVAQTESPPERIFAECLRPTSTAWW